MQYAKTDHILISADETHHLVDNIPLYEQRFLKVLKFHSPGLAPVLSQQGAYHIDLKGKANYEKRFVSTFGFYDNLAAVEDEMGWYHIHPDGTPAYTQRYSWCGNFQHKVCVVKNMQQEYFHIDSHGHSLYESKYQYAGDFRDDYAVVCRADGLSTHVDIRGRYLHNQWFEDLDVFHKGFARAKDKQGWVHINKFGVPLYSQRYAQIEPFYNGIARVETQRGGIVLINEQGLQVGIIRVEKWSIGDELSGKLVNFWSSQAIYVAVKLKVLQNLPSESVEISQKLNISADFVERLLRGLWEIGLVKKVSNLWSLNDAGSLLIDQFYGSAAVMWHDVNKLAWENLPTLLLERENIRHPSLKEACMNTDLLNTYHKALDGYAIKDFEKILHRVNWEAHNKIITCERTGLNLLKLLLSQYNHLKGIAVGHENNLFCVENLLDSLTMKVCDITKNWEEKADAVCLPRCLHYWPDDDAIMILKEAKKSLLFGGKIYIWEMLLEEDSPAGSLLDLNMLAETGGRLRSKIQWEKMFEKVGLKIARLENQLPYLTLIVLEQ